MVNKTNLITMKKMIVLVLGVLAITLYAQTDKKKNTGKAPNIILSFNRLPYITVSENSDGSYTFYTAWAAEYYISKNVTIAERDSLIKQDWYRTPDIDDSIVDIFASYALSETHDGRWFQSAVIYTVPRVK